MFNYRTILTETYARVLDRVKNPQGLILYLNILSTATLLVAVLWQVANFKGHGNSEKSTADGYKIYPKCNYLT